MRGAMSVSGRTADAEVARSERYGPESGGHVCAGHGLAKGTDKGTRRSVKERFGKTYASMPTRTFLAFPQVTTLNKGTRRLTERYAPRFSERYVFPPLFREAGTYLPEPHDQLSLVDTASVRNPDDQHDQVLVLDRVDDPVVADPDTPQVSRHHLRRAARADGWRSHADLKKSIAGRDRPHFDAALEALLRSGQVEESKVEYQGQPGIRYRLIEGRS